MIMPDDWKTYEWRCTEGNGGTNFQNLDAFVWRIQARSDGGGLITFQYQNGVLSTITLVAGEMVGLEPCGMRPGGFVIQFSAGITHWVVEWLRKPQ